MGLTLRVSRGRNVAWPARWLRMYWWCCLRRLYKLNEIDDTYLYTLDSSLLFVNNYGINIPTEDDRNCSFVFSLRWLAQIDYSAAYTYKGSDWLLLVSWSQQTHLGTSSANSSMSPSIWPPFQTWSDQRLHLQVSGIFLLAFHLSRPRHGCETNQWQSWSVRERDIRDPSSFSLLIIVLLLSFRKIALEISHLLLQLYQEPSISPTDQ